MSITLKNNKVVIKQEIDLESILTKLEQEEQEVAYWSISAEIKRNVLRTIETELERAIVSKLNLEQKVEQGDWSEYEKVIDEKIETKIREVVEEKVQKAIDDIVKANWRSSKLDQFVTSSIEKNFTESIHPKISALMEKMITINPVDVDHQMEMMDQYANDMANGAYESGQSDAANAIRSSL